MKRIINSDTQIEYEDIGVVTRLDTSYRKEKKKPGPKEAPLLIIIVSVSLILSFFGMLGKGRGYSSYELDLLTEPALKLVFNGLHDNVMPWEAIIKEPKAQEEITEESSGTVSFAEPIPEETAPESVNYDIPESSQDAVVQAIDYGVADSRILAPAGTVFEHEKSGIFAPDGTYYAFEDVDDGYFKDALFIGDSRTDGLKVFSDMKKYTNFWAKESLSVYNVDSEVFPYQTPEGEEESCTLSELLDTHQFRKIYVSIGVNELGYPTSIEFRSHYKDLLAMIREKEPDAIIFIQAIMHVNKAMSSSDSSFNNTNIVQRNEALTTLANGRDIFYLDMNADVCDSDGNLWDELSNDGVHLKASAYDIWHQSLLKRGIVRTEEDYTSIQEQLPSVEASGNEGAVTYPVSNAGTGEAESDISEKGTVVQ